jgi:hypothetical protein
MWVFLSDAMFSIVQPNEDRPDLLIVRARFENDIQKVFPRATVAVTPRSDYRYRTVVDREEVAAAMAHEVRRIDYPNFKDSVDGRDRRRHDAYLGVWTAMYRAQEEERPWVGSAHVATTTPKSVSQPSFTFTTKKRKRKGKRSVA